MNPTYTTHSYFLNIHFNIILALMSISSLWFITTYAFLLS
jgi:hypothetical protein